MILDITLLCEELNAFKDALVWHWFALKHVLFDPDRILHTRRPVRTRARHQKATLLNWLVVWNIILFAYIGRSSSSQLTNSIIFQRGRYTTNQNRI